MTVPRSWNAGRFNGSFFFDCFNPEFQRQVLALRIAKIRAKLVVTVTKQLQIERKSYGQVPHVTSVALDVAFEFRKREIVGIKRHYARF